MWWYMEGSPFKNVYLLYHRITYTWHEPKRSSIAFAREKHFFFKMFLTIYHLCPFAGLSSMALNFVVLCLCVLIQNSLWSNTFQKSPSFCTVDFQAECIVHPRISERANGYLEMGFIQKMAWFWKLRYIRTLLQSEFWVGDLLTPEQSSVGEHLGDPTGWSLIIY